jgi:hypothetical protein
VAREKKHGPTLRDAGLTAGSTRAKVIRGEDVDRGEATLEDIEQVERKARDMGDRERGTPEAEPERD